MKNMKSTTFIKNLLINSSLTILSFIVFLLILEIGIRLWGSLHGKNFFSNPANKIQQYSSQVIPFRTFGKKLYSWDDQQKTILDRYDKKYPYQKADNTFRVICIGGSTTENYTNYQNSGIHYPMRLEALLQKEYPQKKIEVINTGYGAYTTIHAIILFAFDVIYWNPDLVILSLNINDLTTSYWPNFTTDYSNKFSHSFYNHRLISKEEQLLNFIFRHFRTYWWIHKRLEKIAAAEHIQSVQRKSYGLEPPQEGLKTFSTNLTTFITIAKQNRIRVLLVTEPFEPSPEMFDRHMPNKVYNDIVIYPLQNEFVEHHRRYNQEIAKVAKINGTYFVDLDQEFNANSAYFSDLVHYSDLGIEKLATTLTSYIKAQKLIQNTTVPTPEERMQSQPLR